MVVGDVVGRGIDAATTMGQLRSAVRALATAEAGPARLLEGLDRFVERVESARMATVAYAEIDLTTGELTYACAGHLPPLLHEPAGGPANTCWGPGRRRWARGPATGPAPSSGVRLPAGSRLLLYTDGLIERRNRRIDQGFEVLAREFARRRDAPLQGLTAGAGRHPGRPRPRRRRLPALPHARHRGADRADHRRRPRCRSRCSATTCAAGWPSHEVDDECSEAVLLACSEAVANAIEHGYRDDPFGMVDVVATVAPTRSRSGSPTGAPGAARSRDVARGRGLQLIRESMDQVTFDRTRRAPRVTMRRSRTGGATS